MVELGGNQATTADARLARFVLVDSCRSFQIGHGEGAREERTYQVAQIFSLFDFGALVGGCQRLPAVPWTKRRNRSGVWRSLSTPGAWRPLAQGYISNV